MIFIACVRLARIAPSRVLLFATSRLLLIGASRTAKAWRSPRRLDEDRDSQSQDEPDLCHMDPADEVQDAEDQHDHRNDPTYSERRKGPAHDAVSYTALYSGGTL